MYVLRETITKDGKIISQEDIFKGSYEEAQARMNDKAKADKEAKDGVVCEIKHGEDYYTRVTAETLEWYKLGIRWED